LTKSEWMLCTCLAVWDRFQTSAGREDVVSAVEDISKQKDDTAMVCVRVWFGFQRDLWKTDVFCAVELSKFMSKKRAQGNVCLALWVRFQNSYRTRSCVLCAAVDLFETTISNSHVKSTSLVLFSDFEAYTSKPDVFFAGQTSDKNVQNKLCRDCWSSILLKISKLPQPGFMCFLLRSLLKILRKCTHVGTAGLVLWSKLPKYCMIDLCVLFSAVEFFENHIFPVDGGNTCLGDSTYVFVA
jgi:hypothetical protein